ncbi:MAG: hypothetical protein B0W54_11835 [Cellvibrio sp. 79]|nr:MAG: hypothetical protein B0W54_11835 [Cellvibrio sp. 79]
MIPYKYAEEKTVALTFAVLLNDEITTKILQRNFVESRDEAIHLSQFFWRMIERSVENNIQLPCEGSAEYWTEKLYNSIGGYLEKAGYAAEWNEEIDKA